MGDQVKVGCRKEGCVGGVVVGGVVDLLVEWRSSSGKRLAELRAKYPYGLVAHPERAD